jgi:hypothetical protein
MNFNNDNILPSTPDPWNESALKYLAVQHTSASLLAVLKGIEFLKTRSIAPDKSLHDSLATLPRYADEELDDHAAQIGRQILNIMVSEQESKRPPERGTKIPAYVVFNHVLKRNPYFKRWIQFHSIRPPGHPDDWEPFATDGLPRSDHDYCLAMREFGQMLAQMIADRGQISEHLALCLMHSHELSDPERTVNLLAWIDTVEQEAIR